MALRSFLTAALLLNGAVVGVAATPLEKVSRAIGDACQGDAGDGTCKSVPDCKGIAYTEAYCPNDPSDVMCCVENKCNANGNDGMCRSRSQGCPGGNFDTAGSCVGGDDVACCVPDPAQTETVPQKVLAQAQTAAGLPYAWGGGTCDGPSHDNPPWENGEIGFDCSGLVCWAVCKVTGRDLFAEGLRNTATMYCADESQLKYQKVPLEERQAGDAIFFGGACDCNTDGSIHHVGLMVDDDDRFFNAPNDDVNEVLESSVSDFGEAPCPSVIRFA